MDKKIDISQIKAATRRRLVKVGLVVVAVLAAGWWLLASLEKGVKKSDITIVDVDRGELETTVSATGRVVPAFEEIINSPVTTRILKIFAQPGDSVKAGTPLLELDLTAEQTDYDKMVDSYNIGLQEQEHGRLSSKTQLSELEMQIEVKQMEVNRLKIEVANERKLDSLGSGTGERVRQAETAFNAGVLELKQMRQRLVNERAQAQAADRVKALGNSSIEKDLALKRQTLLQGTVPAPHDGVVTFIVNEIGSQIGAGERVAVVSDLSQFKVAGEVPEGSSNCVGVGSQATVRVGNVELEGTVTNVAPRAQSGMVSFSVSLIEPRHERLRSGLRVELGVNYGYKENVTRLPVGTFFKGPGEYQLFVMDGEDRLERRTVKLGDSNHHFVEVVSGLQPGDRVVVSDMEKYQSKKSLKICQ